MEENEIVVESGPSKLNDDLVWGTKAIADDIGKSLTQTQYLIRKKAIPVGRLGPKTIFASRRQLRQHLTPRLSRKTA